MLAERARIALGICRGRLCLKILGPVTAGLGSDTAGVRGAAGGQLAAGLLGHAGHEQCVLIWRGGGGQ